ncbi:MAG: transposase [Chloroflexi bacterium]|nr:transposase [Chloroflexota bacterium]
MPLGRLIGAFKTVSTKRVNCAHGLSGSTLWQRNFFEHIVRSVDSLMKIRQYIHDNPVRWRFDREYPLAAP